MGPVLYGREPLTFTGSLPTTGSAVCSLIQIQFRKLAILITLSFVITYHYYKYY